MKKKTKRIIFLGSVIPFSAVLPLATVSMNTKISKDKIARELNEKDFEDLLTFAKNKEYIELSKQELSSLKTNKEFFKWTKKRKKYLLQDFSVYINELMQINNLSKNQIKLIIQNIHEKIFVKNIGKENIKSKLKSKRKKRSLYPLLNPVMNFAVPSGGGTGPVDYDFDKLKHHEAKKIYARTSGSNSTNHLFKINGKIVDLAGVTKQVSQHHDGFDSIANLFDGKANTSDVTIFHWSNQRILELIMDTIFGNTIIQKTIKKLRNIETIEGLASWAIDAAANGVALKIKSLINKSNFYKNFFNNKNIKTIPFFKKIIPWLTNKGMNLVKKRVPPAAVKIGNKLPLDHLKKYLFELFKDETTKEYGSIYEGIIPKDGHDKSFIHNLGNGLTTTALYAGAAALGGPVGFLVAAGISFIAHVIPTANGYSAISNWGDHGLNDWKFQMENNFENMVAIAASFSENFIHGISWRVEDSWFDTPDLWIRPGQASNEPWMKLSNEYLPHPTKSNFKIKKFVYGEKIEEQGFESVTKARKRFLAQKMSGKRIFEELGTVYSNGTLKEDYSKFKINTYGGVEYSGSNRHYDITWYYMKNGYWIASRYMKLNIDDYLTAFEPNMNVHENDHDNDKAIKHKNFKSIIPDGYEIEHDSIGQIIVRFENEGKSVYTTSRAWTNLLKESYETAKKWAKDVINGKNPLKNGKRFDLSKYRNNPYVKVVPKYYLHGLNIGRTKFNTYNDPGWDDTHSDKFRHARISVSFKIILEVQHIK